MANRLDPMDIKQIITLHHEGVSNRQIGRILSISRNTVNTYINQIQASDYTCEELLKLPDKELKHCFPGLTTIKNPRYDELMRFLEQVHKARNAPGFTFLHHFNEYVAQAGDPYGYTQFVEHYHRKYKKRRGSMKLDHPPGKEVYIDFAGKKLHYIDKNTGEKVEAEVFVAILPYSQYTFVCACKSQSREDLIACMEKALAFFGGVPLAIVSDNLKAAVSRASKYEPVINKTFKDFARHYNCVVNPTRTYHAQDKALVEGAVRLAYQRIYHPMREMTFFSLTELNQAIAGYLDRYNDLLFQRKDASRKELFQSVERASLKALPDQPYQLKEYCRAKVQLMGYVYFSPDKSYYSVPYRFIGKSTQIEYTPTTVEVYYHQERIAVHQRSGKKGEYHTITDHLSSTHKQRLKWNTDFFCQQARQHGEHVEQVVSRIISSQSYPEIGYKRAMGLIQLHKGFGSERLDKACQMALQYDIYSYLRIKNILHNKMDQFLQEDLEETTTHIPMHQNIRGANYYN